LQQKAVRHASAARDCARRNAAPEADSPPEKNFTAKASTGRTCGPAEAQNARISAERFARAACSAAMHSAVHKGSRQEFRSRFDAARARAAVASDRRA